MPPGGSNPAQHTSRTAPQRLTRLKPRRWPPPRAVATTKPRSPSRTSSPELSGWSGTKKSTFIHHARDRGGITRNGRSHRARCSARTRSWRDRSDRRRTRPITKMALEVALAIGPRRADAHDGQKPMRLHNRPDMRLHPVLIIATIVYALADIREESIY